MSSIRQATSADVPHVERIVREAYGPYVERIGQPPGPMLDDYADLVARGFVSLVEDVEGIKGFVVLILENGSALLDNVAVADRARGQGVGRQLVQHAERLACEAGAHTIRLYTHERMTENRALYPRLGYEETHRASEKGFDRVYFAKRL